MRLLHLSDLHYRPADADLALASLRTVRETVEREHVDLVVFAGDMFDRAIHNSEAGGLPELIDEWTRIDTFCPIVAVTGTPTHDVPGSYHPIVRACDNHGFTLLEPGKAYALYEGTVHKWRAGQPDFLGDPRLLILGCPEPSKEWFLADKSGLGREQAAEAVVGGMRQLLLGLGAIRKEHADLPCLMVYHGQVAGATMANGQTLRPGGVQIGREDLALVGADYYALGDIHLAQQIGDMPAYYAGSAYPCNWGETDRKQAWLVDFGVQVDYEVVGDRPFPRVDAVPFPHAPRRKIVATVGEKFTNADFSGMQVWLHIKDTAENLSHFDADMARLIMKDAGVLDGSRVTLEEIPVETVRAGEIQEAQGLGAKLQIYAENSSEAIPEGVPEKAEQLETEARAEGAAPEGLHIRIDRLKLRGAIGVWKGQGVDEIDLDLGGYDDGLIALLGPNGAGKTTLIENLHPFPAMLTRDGKLQDHYRLRDSYRDLTWTDLRTGDTYRAFIQIDGANTTGGCDYHLYRNGEPIANGRKADYEARILELFGSLSLYLRSAFVTQRSSKGAPELSEATKGERKSLFRELGGLDYLQAYADRAKAHRQEIETALVADQREIEILTGDTEEVPDYGTELKTGQGSLVAARQRIATVEVEGKDARERADAAASRLAAHRKAETEINGLRNQVVTLGHERANAQQTIVALKATQAMLPDIRKQIAVYEALKAEEGKLNADRTSVLLERERIQSQHGRALKAHQDEVRKLESRQRELASQEAALLREKDATMLAVDRLEERLSHPIECPGCHLKFTIGGEADAAACAEKQQHVLDLDIDLMMVERQTKAVAGELAAMVAPPEPTLPKYDEAPLASVETRLMQYDVRMLRESLEQATTADAKIEAAGARIMAIEVQVAGLRGQIEGLESKLDPAAVDEQQDTAAALATLEAAWRDARATVARLEAEVKALEAQIAEIVRKRHLLVSLRVLVATREANAAAWAWLQRACGPDGIQALELDAMGPGIAAVANRILEAAYGSRFSLSFVTARLSGSGARAKQVEDFQIIVHDSERGGEQPLETLSGGEMVWVRKALFDAFSIVRDRATGQRFLTAFVDEADGALDPEARIAYVRMLEAAHVESGRRHTILITHSETVQQMIAQRIEMGELAGAGE